MKTRDMAEISMLAVVVVASAMPTISASMNMKRIGKEL